MHQFEATKRPLAERRNILITQDYDLLFSILRFCGSVDGAMASSKPCRGGAG